MSVYKKFTLVASTVSSTLFLQSKIFHWSSSVTSRTTTSQKEAAINFSIT